jgi:nucleoside 2-deoxyribosyltransferase
MGEEIRAMNLYFSCSLTGGRSHEAIYSVIVDHLISQGHEVPTSHLACPEVMRYEDSVNPSDVYQRDITWIQSCDAVIAEVSTPSHGVGYEIAYALSLSKPVLCCYQLGIPVSKMLTGNDSPGIVLNSYRDEAEALAIVDVFLADVGDA